MKVTLGGDRLRSGNKMKVEIEGYGRSTQNLDALFKSPMSAGTLVPFLSEVMLPGDIADIDLTSHILTLPTVGPLFGSFKVQLDLFSIPWRLYNSQIHNNRYDIGRDIAQAKVPQIELTALPLGNIEDIEDLDNCQINPSCLLQYFGISGIGIHDQILPKTRQFNAMPILMYWDTVKNYYCNLQEGIGAVIHNTEASPTVQNITNIGVQDTIGANGSSFDIPEKGTPPNVGVVPIGNGWEFFVQFPVNDPLPDADQVIIQMQNSGPLTIRQLVFNLNEDAGAGQMYGTYNFQTWGNDTPLYWYYATNTLTRTVAPNVVTFPLQSIDDMRMKILAFQSLQAPYIINDADEYPYRYLYEQPNDMPNSLYSQEGLAVKTYLSDRFNNWLDTDFQDHISNISAISTVGDSFTIDQLNLSQKIYDLYNKIAATGGSFDDWQEAVYDVRQFNRPEIPVFIGGMSGELQFQQVISNSASGNQPLATLAGRGQLTNVKGGRVKVRFDEASYLIGLVSLTPRIEYSQGNKWDTQLKTWDDLHKPSLDQIGFQDLPTEELAWWDTTWDQGTTSWVQKSAGLQPSWIHYMTNVNRTYGDFAIATNSMFMTLNRRYEWENGTIKDLTTYIDPAKFNYIFAQQSIDATNFWTQIGIKLRVRRKISAKIMPNLR